MSDRIPPHRHDIPEPAPGEPWVSATNRDRKVPHHTHGIRPGCPASANAVLDGYAPHAHTVTVKGLEDLP